MVRIDGENELRHRDDGDDPVDDECAVDAPTDGRVGCEPAGRPLTGAGKLAGPVRCPGVTLAAWRPSWSPSARTTASDGRPVRAPGALPRTRLPRATAAVPSRPRGAVLRGGTGRATGRLHRGQYLC